MFALVLVGALVSQSLAAPSNCGTASVCDPHSGRQVYPGSSQSNSGYSSIQKWGSESSWASGTLANGQSSNLETFDESGRNRPGSWRDEKSYVTDDRKGKIDYKAEQQITGNSYRKSASSSYSWGSNDYNEAKPNSQIIHSSQFDGQIRDVERDMAAFIGQFSFNSGSIVNQQTLDSFRREADRYINQVTGLCDQTSVNSEDYRRLQRIKENFERQVELKQQEIMNIVIEHKQTITGSITSSSSGGSYVQRPQPLPHYPTKPVYPEPIYQAPVTVNPIEIRRERVQTECNVLHENIQNFYRNFVTAQYNTYDRVDTLATFRAQVNAQIAAINEQIANLRIESANFDYQRNFVEEMNKTFESYVTNMNQQIKACEERILAEQRRLIEAEERLNRQKLEREREETERLYQENLRKIEAEHARQQKELEEQQRIEEERLAQRKHEAQVEWERKKAEAERQTIVSRPHTPSLPQIQLPVQTVTPSVDVHQSGDWRHQIDVHISGSQQHQISSSTIGGGGVTSGQQIHYQPSIGPHIDFADIQNKMNQEFNRLVSSVNRLSSYSMQLTESNQQTISAQFERDVNELRRKIENLCQESNQYNNDHIFKASEELKRTLEQSFQYFQQELAKISASGGYQENSSWGSSGAYTHFRPPHISNIEINHQKSTEIELTHGGRGNVGQQQVNCFEEYANQPCIEPVRVRREAGGYYSQQHESNLDEYTPRRRNHRRRYESEVEDYSQQHVDPQLELDDYSQRTGQIQLPRNRQEHIQSDSYRRRGETQSHNLQQIEDMRRQENVSDDHYSQRNYDRRPYSSRYDQRETEDLSQQSIQSGQNEELQAYERPRSDHSSQQYVQSEQSENLQSYQKPRSERIQNSSQQSVQSGESEDLQSYQKPRNERIRDESQQYVQSGQSEELQSYQRPRNQRTEDSSQQYVQNEQSENSHSYQRPRNQRTEDSSQQYAQSENLQSYQRPRNQRSEGYSQQYVQNGESGHLQSHQRPQSQRTEDSSQQYVQSEDLQTYQRPRNQRNHDESQQYVQSGQSEDLQSYQRPRSQRTEDSSQQYIQSGQSEDLQSYQRPRSQRTEDSSQQYVQNGQSEDSQSYQKPRRNEQIHAANLQREQSSASTGRTLLDQGLVVDEPQDIVKPIVKPGKLGTPRGVNDYNLENSGFYDNPKLQENSKLNDNLQQSYERPSQTQTLETHGKLSGEIQKPRGSSVGQLTLENSGFDNYQKQNEQYSVTESPTEQVTTFKNLAGSQQLEDMTLQQSGFFENAGQGQNLEKFESQRNEDLVQNDDRQQSSVQMNLGPEVQPGRGANLKPERINSYNDRAQQHLVPAAPSTSNREYGQREHPVGQYMHNLPQQNGPSSPNVIDLDSNEPNVQYVNADNQDKVLPLDEQQSLVTVYPPVRPAPKPVPRYTRPWQVSQNVNVLQRPANNFLEQSETQNTHNSYEPNRHSEAHRGDLPGRSDPTTEEPVYIPPQTTPAPTVRPTTQAPITEAPKQETVKPEVPTQRTPCYFNRCQNNQFDDLSQTYYYRQQHEQNIRFSQQSTYNNQQNLGLSIYQRHNPFYQANSQSQFNQQVSPVNYGPEHGYTFRYKDEQTNHLSINNQGSTRPTESISFEQRDLLGLNGQENSQQQVQHLEPSFGNSPGQREFSQHHSTFSYNQQSNYSPDEGFPARVIPLDEAQSRNIWADVESTTRPTFWKRVGHKISNTYEKVKESARTVYG